MKYLRFFAKTASIILAALVILIICGRVFIPKYATENVDGRVTGDYYAEEGPVDVIFVGSSTVYNAYIPACIYEEYGFTSYDRANASQTIWQSYYMIRDAINYNKPKMVVLDASFMKYGEEFKEEPSNRKTIDGMRLTVDKMMAAKVSMYEEESLLSYVFPILRFHSRWNDLKMEDLKYAFSDPKVTYDGFIIETGRDEEAAAAEEGSDESFAGFPDKPSEYLMKIIKLCRDEDVTLLIAKTPTLMDNWYVQYDEELDRIAKENGLVYINFDNAMDDIGLVQTEDYVDGYAHLNVFGAEKFSHYAGAYLRDNYDLPDRRGDESTNRAWENRYFEYQNARANAIAKD